MMLKMFTNNVIDGNATLFVALISQTAVSIFTDGTVPCYSTAFLERLGSDSLSLGTAEFEEDKDKVMKKCKSHFLPLLMLKEVRHQILYQSRLAKAVFIDFIGILWGLQILEYQHALDYQNLPKRC